MKPVTKIVLILGIIGNILTFLLLGRIHAAVFFGWLFSLFLIETHDLIERSN